MKTYSKYRVAALLFMCISTWMILACTQQQTDSSRTEPAVDEIATYSVDTAESEEEEEEEEVRQPKVLYHLDSIADQTALDSFQTRYSEEEKKIIFALNRMDAWRLDPGDVLVIPDSLVNDLLYYSPFPKEMPLLDSIAKAILISQRIQAIGLYEEGKLIRWGPVSSGKASTPTPNGLHYGNFRAKRKVSTVNKDWLLPYYFNFMNFEGVGVHQYSMPGYPASHACVRLLDEDARFIYDWADQWVLNENEQVIIRNGTPFMVFGTYDYSGAVPWLNLAKDHKDNFFQLEELDTLKSYVEQYFRDYRNFPPKDKEEQVL